MSECQGTDFSRPAQALDQALIEHADRDGLRGPLRAVFLDRGGHAPGDFCPSASQRPAQRHEYWCEYPERECDC